MTWLAACAAAAAVWNFVALLTVVADKRAAQKNGEAAGRRRRRVPERRFLMFAATFAGAGVLVGFYCARHKTLHRRLLAGVWCLTLLSYAALAGFVFWRYLLNT